MASGELGYDNLQRALRGFEQALSLDSSDYPEFVRVCWTTAASKNSSLASSCSGNTFARA